MSTMKVTSIILLVIIGQAYAGDCPQSADSIKPCTCTGAEVKCFAYNHDLDLASIFETIAHGHNPGDQVFDRFTLTSNKIDTLDADVFQGVAFRIMEFNFNPKLACVNPRAFSGMEKITNQFLSVNTAFSTLNDTTNCNLFSAMSSLINLQIINITGSEMTQIPERAFHGRGGPQNQLARIDLSGGQGGFMTKIGKSAFSELKALTYLDLSGHKIATIDTFAFGFTEAADLELTINLEHNYDNTAKSGLTGESFGSSAFLVGNRRTTLKLGANPGLKYLKEDPFHAFLENKANGVNKIDLQGTYLGYYWENKWILEYRASLNLDSKIGNARMEDGEELLRGSIKAMTGTPTTQATTLTNTGSTTRVTGPTVSATGSTPKASTAATITSTH